MALGTFDRRLEESMHQINNYGLVALLVIGPGLLGDFLVGTTVLIDILSVRLVNDSVEVFMQSVENEREHFAGIVLLVPLKLKLF